MVGPTNKVLLHDTPDEDLADTSNTALIFVLADGVHGQVKHLVLRLFQVRGRNWFSMSHIEILFHDGSEFIKLILGME